MSHYMHRTGVNEQVRYLRNQPHSMRDVPFDFEIIQHERRIARAEKIVGWLSAIGLAAIIYRGWLW